MIIVHKSSSDLPPFSAALCVISTANNSLSPTAFVVLVILGCFCNLCFFTFALEELHTPGKQVHCIAIPFAYLEDSRADAVGGHNRQIIHGVAILDVGFTPPLVHVQRFREKMEVPDGQALWSAGCTC